MLYAIQLSEDQVNLGAFEFGGHKLPPFLNKCTKECTDKDVVNDLLYEMKVVEGNYRLLNKELFKSLDGKKIEFRLNNSKPSFRDGGRFIIAVKDGIMFISRGYINYAGDDDCQYTWVFQDRAKYEFWDTRVQEGLNSERLEELKSAVDALKFNGMTVNSIISQIKKWEVM